MRLADLADRLVKADGTERLALLRENSALAGVELARLLKDICLEGWSTHPTQALGAAAAVRILADQLPDPEINALHYWTEGLEALVQGRMEQAIDHLNQSQSAFLNIGKNREAAATQVSKLVALAMLGSYDQAIACGLDARDVLLSEGDLLNAGKIEHNVGNIYFRRDQYHDAEKFQKLARERFLALNDASHLTKIENSLALTLTQQHKLREAEELYEQALHRAEESEQLSTQAAIESSIGTMALYQGRYDRALDYLERSRRNYAQLGMAHLSALTEQEIADSYLELNLIPEATEIYQRVTRTFADLGMRAEEARALAYHARAAIVSGETAKAHSLLERAAELFSAEKNDVGRALVKLTEAQAWYAQHNCSGARQAAASAEPAFAAAGALRRLMFARWLQGEAARCEGSTDAAREILTRTLREASSDEPDLAARCLTSLGLLTAKANDRVAAEQSFKDAIATIEQLRAPLPGEEFRTSFFADKLTPYQEMMRLCLDDGREADAFAYSEMARSRALADTLAGDVSSGETVDDFERDLNQKIEVARQELKFLYRRQNVPLIGTRATSDGLRSEIRSREAEILKLTRQLRHRRPQTSGAGGLRLSELQQQLGDATLIEYASIDDELIAFVVSRERIEAIRKLGSESEIAREIEQFRFQIDSLRFGSAAIRKHLANLTVRARKHLTSLYSMLVAPLRAKLSQRVIIVPHRTLHYLPFAALHDSQKYLVEEFEFSYAPSAVVFQQCVARPRKDFRHALLLGIADQTIPRVTEEIEAIGRVFPEADKMLNEQATSGGLKNRTAVADVVHLACHAHFRSDNPLFSSLQLADGSFTVRDACALKLNCGLVTLSACETGVNAIVPGDELIGLARGFFSAGAPSVLLSLWTVDDDATRIVMENFYRRLRAGDQISAALRAAQTQLLSEHEHPFFWAPFVPVGR